METTSPCKRCGVRCVTGRVVGERQVYPLVTMKAAQSEDGLCSCCAAHWWLYTVDGIRWALEEGGNAVLRYPQIQKMLSALMAHMHPEFGSLDWGRLLEQWQLPWPDDWALFREVQ